MTRASTPFSAPGGHVMNLKLVSRLVGRVLLVEAFFAPLPLAVALLYQEDPAPPSC